MTLFRISVILAGGLALLLAVVIMRAQTTRLHYQIARCVREADQVRQRVLEAELELARLRNPTRVRQRVEEVISGMDEEAAPEQAPRSPRATRGGERRGRR